MKILSVMTLTLFMTGCANAQSTTSTEKSLTDISMCLILYIA